MCIYIYVYIYMICMSIVTIGIIIDSNGIVLAKRTIVWFQLTLFSWQRVNRKSWSLLPCRISLKPMLGKEKRCDHYPRPMSGNK